MYQMAVGSQSSWRWRHRGSTPNPDAFVGSLWADVLMLHVAERVSDGQRIGYMSSTRADFRNGHCYLSAVSSDKFHRTPYPAEAAILFMVHLLNMFPFRKIYFELPEFNAEQMGHSLRVVGDIEGRLREYEFYDGRYWDTFIVSISRKQVADILAPLVKSSVSDTI